MIRPFDRPGDGAAGLRGLAPGGFVDVHCHALPGLDDGPRTSEEAARLLDGLGALGYSRVAATPHFRHAGFETPAAAEIGRLVAEWNGAASGGRPSLVAGAEIAFDERFLADLEAGSLPRLGTGRTYLLELPNVPGSVPARFEEVVFRLAARGVAIVIAHAERIPDLQRGSSALGALRRAGALAQVDLTSLAGKHGRTARDLGFELVETGAADVVATDAHSPSDLPLVERALTGLADLDPDLLRRLAASNPAAILDGAIGEVARHE